MRYDWGGLCKHIVAVMLAVLQQKESGQPIPKEAPKEKSKPVSLKPLLDSLSAEQLRAFVRLQAAEFPQLANNLQIFSAGATAWAQCG